MQPDHVCGGLDRSSVYGGIGLDKVSEAFVMVLCGAGLALAVGAAEAVIKMVGKKNKELGRREKGRKLRECLSHPEVVVELKEKK